MIDKLVFACRDEIVRALRTIHVPLLCERSNHPRELRQGSMSLHQVSIVHDAIGVEGEGNGSSRERAERIRL